MKYLQQTISGVAGNGRAPRSSIFAAPRTSAWAPRSSTCNKQRAAPRAAAWPHDEVPSTSNKRRRGQRPGATIKYLRGAADIGLGTTIKYLSRRRGHRPGHRDQLSATRNERFRWRRPGHHFQVPAAHSKRRRRQRLGLVTASPVMTKSRAPAGGNNYPENGLVKPPRRDTRALSPAGMFGGKAPLRLAAQKSRPHAHSVPMRSAPPYFLCKWGL